MLNMWVADFDLCTGRNCVSKMDTVTVIVIAIVTVTVRFTVTVTVSTHIVCMMMTLLFALKFGICYASVQIWNRLEGFSFWLLWENLTCMRPFPFPFPFPFPIQAAIDSACVNVFYVFQTALVLATPTPSCKSTAHLRANWAVYKFVVHSVSRWCRLTGLFTTDLQIFRFSYPSISSFFPLLTATMTKSITCRIVASCKLQL